MTGVGSAEGAARTYTVVMLEFAVRLAKDKRLPKKTKPLAERGSSLRHVTSPRVIFSRALRLRFHEMLFLTTNREPPPTHPPA